MVCFWRSRTGTGASGYDHQHNSDSMKADRRTLSLCELRATTFTPHTSGDLYGPPAPCSPDCCERALGEIPILYMILVQFPTGFS